MLKKYFGTAGWSYKDWVGPFYPKNQTGGFDWLRFYANYFNSVEVNATYYAYLDPKTAKGWVNKVEDNDDFVFTLKLHQDFTHKKDFNQDKISAVCYLIDILAKAERFGALLLQFPYSFSFNNVNAEYVRKLNEIFRHYNRFIEVRHRSWHSKNGMELLHNLDLPVASIDQPDLGEAIQFESIAINGKAYIRLHGRNIDAWKKSIRSFGKKQTYEEQSERYKYLYSPAEILEISEKIKEMLAELKTLFVVTNNHPGGNAVANLFQLENMINGEKLNIPEATIKRYPYLKRIAL